MNGALSLPTSSYDNGDGTFTFTMPNGDDMTASGPVAAKKHAQLQEQVDLNPALAMARQQATPDQRLAFNGGGFDAGVDPSVVASFNAQDQGRRADAASAAVNPGTFDHAAGPPLAATAGPTPADLRDMMDKPIPRPAAKAGGGGSVDPSKLVGAGGGQSDAIPTVMAGGGATGRRVVPGKLALAGKQVSQTNIAPEAERHIDVSSEIADDANNAQTEGEVAQSEQLAGIKDASSAWTGELDNRAQIAEKQRQSFMADSLAKYKALTDKAQQMQDIDPEKSYWDHKTGGRLQGHIAMALGAMGSSLSKTPNFAANQINAEIDREVDKQKFNVQKAKGAAEDQKGLLGGAMAAFGDARQAEAATKAAYLQQTIQKLDATMEGTKSPLIRARGMALRSQLLEKMGMREAEFHKTTETNSYAMTKPTVVGGGVAPVNVHDDVKKEQVVKGPDGKGYEFGEGATAQEAAKKLAAISHSQGLSNRLAEITSNPANLADPAKRAEAASIAATLVRNQTAAEGGNGPRLNDKTYDLAQRSIGGDPNALLAFGKSAGLAEYQNTLRTEGSGIIAQHAISEVKSYREVNPKTGEATLRFVRQRRGPQGAPDLAGKREGE